MAEKTLKTRIALRHDEPANWTNQVLAKGEVGFEFTTEGKKKMKAIGTVEVPQEAFLAILSTDEDK